MPVLHPRRQTHDCSFDQSSDSPFLNANTLIDTAELTTAMGDCLSMFEITRLNLIQVFFGVVVMALIKTSLLYSFSFCFSRSAVLNHTVVFLWFEIVSAVLCT